VGPPVGRLLAALYAVEAAVVVCALALYKRDHRFPAFLATRDGLIFALAALCALAAAAYLVRTWRRTRGGDTRWISLTAAMNAVSLVLFLLLAETAVRALSSETPEGIAVHGVPLLPVRSWEATVARNREILGRALRGDSYFVVDESLGWTVGPSRRSKDGRYASSVEGIRSERPGISYAAAKHSRRVALVGDSYAFGLEVGFKDSWGYRLQQDLGASVQVLNFGVEGYGIDQGYLRYRKDVRAWHPDLVIFGFIDHDLYRSMAVYPFVSFPEWEYPVEKPRFVVRDGKLELPNVPVIAPERILELRSVTDLPFIELDRGYEPRDWEWRPYYYSRLVRFLLSRFRPPPNPVGQTSDAAMTEVNAALIASFVELAKKEGSSPLVVYFPQRVDYHGGTKSGPVLKKLEERGVEVEDLTECLRKVDVAALFIEGRPHYSPAGNAAATACLEPAVKARLAER
jgi:hypothetical protein